MSRHDPVRDGGAVPALQCVSDLGRSSRLVLRKDQAGKRQTFILEEAMRVISEWRLSNAEDSLAETFASGCSGHGGEENRAT